MLTTCLTALTASVPTSVEGALTPSALMWYYIHVNTHFHYPHNQQVLLDLAPLEGPDNLCVDAGSELSVLELYGAIGRLLDESHRTETLAVNYAQCCIDAVYRAQALRTLHLTTAYTIGIAPAGA
eukprot:18623-Heterococcus_DN1.PRE.1